MNSPCPGSRRASGTRSGGNAELYELAVADVFPSRAGDRISSTDIHMQLETAHCVGDRGGLNKTTRRSSLWIRRSAAM